MATKIVQKKEASVVEQPASQYTFTPKADIWETSNQYQLEIEMPGVDQSGVEVQLEDGVLSVLGRTTPENPNGYTRTYAEYEVGNYERKFSVADNIDTGKITASIKNGVLAIALPKTEAAQPKRIEVRVG